MLLLKTRLLPKMRLLPKIPRIKSAIIPAAAPCPTKPAAPEQRAERQTRPAHRSRRTRWFIGATVLAACGRPDLSPEENFLGQQKGNNCAPQSCQQIIKQATGKSYTEAQMEQMGQDSHAYDPKTGTRAGGEADILKRGGVDAHTQAQTPENIQKALDNGQGVITGHDAATLWEGDPNYTADPANPVNGGHAVHTTGLVRDANGNVTHYVINDTGTGTSGRMVPADQFHQSLDTGPAVVTDAPIRTPTAAREAGLPASDAPTAGEAPGAPRDAASRGDPTSERGDTSERAPSEAEKSGEAESTADTPEAKVSGEDASGEDAKAAGDGDPTVPIGDRPGGLRNAEDEDGGSQEDQTAGRRGANSKYPLRTPESNEAARTVRDAIEKGLKDKTLRPRWLWKAKHPTVGVTTYSDHTVDVALSGGHGNVNESAAKLQGLLPDNYRVVTVGDAGTIGSEFPGYQSSSNVSSKTGEVWCAEPKLAAAAKEYQTPDATGREATGQTIFWRGEGENGYPISAADRAPGEADIDLMNPCASCRKNEGAYMQDVVTGNDDSGSD